MLIRTEQELEEFGEKVALEILKGERKTTTLALVGELGAGKTTFARGFARGLGIDKVVTSPTFVLAKRYKTESDKILWHVDAYRLGGAEDMESIAFEEMLKDPNIVTVVEWADKVRSAMPEDAMWIMFEHHKNGRSVTNDNEELP